MSDDRFSAVMEDIRAFVNERDWHRYHDPKNLAMAVGSEAGELLSELRWVDGEAADTHCQEPEARARVRDEIADVLVCTLMLADRIGLDPLQAIHDKLKKNRVKYPAPATGE